MTAKTASHGSDRRVRRTRAAIQAALTELILEKGYDSVTVSDIIDRADIGRSTFYSHFTDKRDVFDDTIAELSGFLRSQPTAADGRMFCVQPSLVRAHRRAESRSFGRSSAAAATRVAMQTTSAALAEVIAEDLATRDDNHATGSDSHSRSTSSSGPTCR